MEQEIIKPETQPAPGSQAFSRTGSLMAAVGATLLMLCFTGSAMVASVWAMSKLIGLPDIVIYGLIALGIIPVLWITVWTAGRAWHVERLIAQHRDIDVPVFSLLYYFKNR